MGQNGWLRQLLLDIPECSILIWVPQPGRFLAEELLKWLGDVCHVLGKLSQLIDYSHEASKLGYVGWWLHLGNGCCFAGVGSDSLFVNYVPQEIQLCFPIIAFLGVEGHPSCLNPPENFSQSLVVLFGVSAID